MYLLTCFSCPETDCHLSTVIDHSDHLLKFLAFFFLLVILAAPMQMKDVLCIHVRRLEQTTVSH